MPPSTIPLPGLHQFGACRLQGKNLTAKIILCLRAGMVVCIGNSVKVSGCKTDKMVCVRRLSAERGRMPHSLTAMSWSTERSICTGRSAWQPLQGSGSIRLAGVGLLNDHRHIGKILRWSIRRCVLHLPGGGSGGQREKKRCNRDLQFGGVISACKVAGLTIRDTTKTRDCMSQFL